MATPEKKINRLKPGVILINAVKTAPTHRVESFITNTSSLKALSGFNFGSKIKFQYQSFILG